MLEKADRNSILNINYGITQTTTNNNANWIQINPLTRFKYIFNIGGERVFTNCS